MSLVKVRRAAQLTLPADVRRKLNLKEGDLLEAKIVEEGVLLKPVSVVDRERAWQRILDATAGVVDLEAKPGEDAVAKEEEIAKLAVETVREYRRQHRRNG